MSGDTFDPVRRWLKLKAEITALDAKRRELVEQKDEAEKEALDVFEHEGIPSVKVDGKTVSIRRDLRAYVRVAEVERVAAVLDECGLSNLAKLTINPQTLSAHVREQEQLGIPLPEALVEVIEINELFSLSAVASSRS